MWVPPEETDPILFNAPTRKSVALFGAVDLCFGRVVTQFDPKFDAMTFGRFLQKLVRYRRRGHRLVIILDNARYHHARALKPFLNRYRNWLKLLFLPPYSPDFNPIERLWKLTRKLCTHNQYFPQLHDLVNAVTIQFESWRKPNKTVHKLCGII